MFVAEHDIFGEALSDSDEDETNNNLLALDEDNSRLSMDDTRTSQLSDSAQMPAVKSTCTDFYFILMNTCIILLTWGAWKGSFIKIRN